MEWKLGTVHISPTLGKVEEQEPGINIKLLQEPDGFHRNITAEAATATSSWGAGAGKEERTVLLWGLKDPSLAPERVSSSSDDCSNPVPLSGASRHSHCRL